MRADAQKNYDHLLAVARTIFLEQGNHASLRDIARRAEVGLGTLYRHFPNREALLEALLRSSFEAMAKKADELRTADDCADALMLWLQEVIAFTHEHRGVIAPMMSAIEDPESALHASCIALRTAGAALLSRAQAEGKARADLNGAELFDLIAAVAWLREQASHAARADRIFSIIAGAILSPSESNA
ncbi:TetR/AcrR family transcriptional regulator [Herbaspirillum rubrisubalbicans]|jgi:AcrR family transcriptional regulator|uniref:TetR/AcrR family transcriptional regulator n=1 Tax=Herbaspirillum rubrisubalbicans Os34 TaxID=1235827 RepID=A0A6M3ZLY7_9BURK|nr:TetR/AcrR family transcriptional regulator [Herbaspirillum rubrisubalbicans]NQE50030.1 TetR family transcriptional regulator [Herbaspirillum rubrisubalbicans]QJP99637.1 TetR/AcrR family transcriptional regulator [Herbaspirillum rubrisubalbicans Os34]